jgi:hypothetical protein
MGSIPLADPAAQHAEIAAEAAVGWQGILDRTGREHFPVAERAYREVPPLPLSPRLPQISSSVLPRTCRVVR